MKKADLQSESTQDEVPTAVEGHPQLLELDEAREERLHRCGSTEATHADTADSAAAQAAGALCLCAAVLVVQGEALRPGIVVRR